MLGFRSIGETSLGCLPDDIPGFHDLGSPSLEASDALLSLPTDGTRIQVCEYIKVTWASGVTNYYGSAAFNEIAPFTAIGVTVEPRLIPRSDKDHFLDYEINPDLRSQPVPIVFRDEDHAITGKFNTYSSGVQIEIYRYYPQSALVVRTWGPGQLQAPEIYGWKTIRTTATYGAITPEKQTPDRRHLKECTARNFGGRLPDAESIRSNGCSYDRHIGGSSGLYRTGTTAFIECPQMSEADCILRFGHNRNYMGFNTDVSPVLTDPKSGYLATSRGNATSLGEAVRVVFGRKTVRGNLNLLWRREGSRGEFIRGIWEVCEGPISSIGSITLNEYLVPELHINRRTGERAQLQTVYAPNVSNFSGTAHVNALFASADAGGTTGPELASAIQVTGFSEVCVYTSSSAKTRIWSDNRIWCLLEMYKNQKFGLGCSESLFNIDDWITAATWSDVNVTFTVTFEDGETRVYTSRRSEFNAIVEGRSFVRQIEDICRSGGVSIPFLYNGQMTISPLRKATSPELAAAPTFYDTGQNTSIVKEDKQPPKIERSQIPDNKIPNEIEVTFEDASNGDTERPVVVDDRNQKLKAGRQNGTNYLLDVPKKYSAFGVSALAEAIRLAYRLLWFGEFDEGGIQNNVKVKITVPFEQCLSLKRYQIIKISSAILSSVTIGINGATDLRETLTYFRLLSMVIVGGGQVEITAQAYNHTAYTAFEVDAGGTAAVQVCTVLNAGSLQANGLYMYAGHVGSKPSYTNGAAIIAWNTGNSHWEFTDGSGVMYHSLSSVAYPWLATWLRSGGDTGEDPAPLVFIGALDPPTGDLTISSATYDDTTGLMSITV